MPIGFYSESISFSLSSKIIIKRWLSDVIKSEKETLGSVNFIFCSDKYLFEMNKKYLNHNTFTDIITFDYCEELKISGDIFISIERVKENSKKFGANFEDELNRVMVHGVLHLLGYKDKTKSAKEVMTKKENLYLKKIKR